MRLKQAVQIFFLEKMENLIPNFTETRYTQNWYVYSEITSTIATLQPRAQVA